MTQNSPGIPGTAEAGDRFGAALSINYSGRLGGIVDVAVGVPNEDIGSLADAGSVIVLQDLYDPVETAVALDQNSAGVPGVAEAGDRFGRSLDSVNVISDGTIATRGRRARRGRRRGWQRRVRTTFQQQ